MGLTHPAGAQTAPPRSATPRLNLFGSFRSRYEMLSGQVRPGFGRKDDLLSFRTILGAEYRDGPLTLAAELWDSRAYAADRRTPVTTSEVNALEPVQVYALRRFDAALGTGTSVDVQAGRFILNLGSRRLVAADDYRNTTNGYTGVRTDLSLRDGWHGTLIYVLPQLRRPDDLDGLLDNRAKLDRESFGLVLWGGVVSKAGAIGAATLEGSFYRLDERDSPSTPTRDRSLNTVSVRLNREPKVREVDVEAELIGQNGHAAAGTAPGAPLLPVRAWFAHLDIGYLFDAAWHPRLSFDYDRASGDGPGRRYTRFDTLFGMRRADLAPSGLYGAISRANLSSPGLRLEATPSAKTDIMLSVRSMWAASRTDSFAASGVRDASGRSGRFAGSQADGRIRYRASKSLTLEADGILLRKGRLLREAPNARPGRWTSYLSLNVVKAF